MKEIITLALLTTSVVAMLETSTPAAETASTASQAARLKFDELQAKIRMASAILLPESLDRCERIGALEDMMLRTEAELSFRRAEQNRLRAERGQDALRLSIESQQHIDELEKGRTELQKRHCETKAAHRNALTAKSQSVKTLADPRSIDALLKQLRSETTPCPEGTANTTTKPGDKRKSAGCEAKSIQPATASCLPFLWEVIGCPTKN